MNGKAAIITAFDPFSFRGGIETYSLQICNLLKSHNIDCDVVCLTDDIGNDHGFHNDFLGRLYSMGKRFFGKEWDYDFIIANAFYGLGYFPPRMKVFNVFHSTHKGFAGAIKDVVPMSQYLEWKLLWGELCESVCGFGRIRIAVSESVRSELEGDYGFQEVEVLHNGVDTKTFAKVDRRQSRIKWNIPPEADVGLYVGRWDLLKGSDILEGVIARTPDVRWVVVLGTGSDQSAIPRFGNLQIIEQAAHEDMREIYSAADFVLFPSLYEGFGYVITEAMACGLPVIATNVGIVKTIYAREPFDRLLLPGISSGREALVSSAVEKIAMLRKDTALRASFAVEGRRVVERDFDIGRWEAGISKILGLS